jgi:two-component system, chemotaxis family, sensor kinase CheA
VHMVRNAVDHGIEPSQTRQQLGKPATGHIYLDAYHQGDCIVIEVRDDGRGLDREKLIAKAVERGLIERDEQLTDQQTYALIMQPGFSMADKVTDISGRGVGMDVVKRNVEALRGKIEIQSELGRGTTFLIRLPLTLAIIDGMIVRVGQERVVVPTVLIEQSLRPQATHISTVQGRGEVMMVRGELCPLVQLGRLFGYSQRIDPCESIVIIVHCETRKIGLVVDELIGQQQVVIKSLADSFKQVSGVSGAAILGDGRVGLILDPTGILNMHNRHHGELADTKRSAAPDDDASDMARTADTLTAALVN